MFEFVIRSYFGKMNSILGSVVPLATFPYKAKIDQREMTWAYVRLGFEAKIDEKKSWSST